MPRSYGITNVAPWASAPPIGPAGDSYYNTGQKVLYLADGTVWNPVTIPPAGLGGMVLTKNSQNDFDAAWQVNSGAEMSTFNGDLSQLITPGIYVRTSIAGDPIAAGNSVIVEVLAGQDTPQVWRLQRMSGATAPTAGQVWFRTTSAGTAAWTQWFPMTPTAGTTIRYWWTRTANVGTTTTQLGVGFGTLNDAYLTAFQKDTNSNGVDGLYFNQPMKVDVILRATGLNASPQGQIRIMNQTNVMIGGGSDSGQDFEGALTNWGGGQALRAAWNLATVGAGENAGFVVRGTGNIVIQMRMSCTPMSVINGN